MSDEARWKMDCSQCDVFRTTETEEHANELRDFHQRTYHHNSAIVTKLRFARHGW
jgi:hypothetical protein